MTGEEVVQFLVDDVRTKIQIGDTAWMRPSLLALVQAVLNDNGVPAARKRDEIVKRLRAALGL